MFFKIREAWAVLTGTDPSSPDYRKGYDDCCRGLLLMNESGIHTISCGDVLHFRHEVLQLHGLPFRIKLEGIVRRI